MKTIISLIFSFFLTTTIVFAQSTINKADSTSIEKQFDYIIKSSNRYQDYRVIKTYKVLNLKKSITDSISAYKKEYSIAKSEINAQHKTIDSLKNVVNNSEETIITLKDQTHSISFLGIQIDKSVFKTILLSVIAVLAILLLIFITKFKKSNSITNQAKEDLRELDEEFETHRKKALEREQKVRRQLQDELNKQKKDS